MRTLSKIVLAGILVTLPSLAQASDSQDDENGKKEELIGVFHPIPTSLSFNHARCPDASSRGKPNAPLDW
jgi:hypothetical protein